MLALGDEDDADAVMEALLGAEQADTRSTGVGGMSVPEPLMVCHRGRCPPETRCALR